MTTYICPECNEPSIERTTPINSQTHREQHLFRCNNCGTKTKRWKLQKTLPQTTK